MRDLSQQVRYQVECEKKNYIYSFSRGHSWDFGNLIGSSCGLDFPISAHGHGNPDVSFCLFVFLFSFSW